MEKRRGAGTNPRYYAENSFWIVNIENPERTYLNGGRGVDTFTLSNPSLFNAITSLRARISDVLPHFVFKSTYATSEALTCEQTAYSLFHERI